MHHVITRVLLDGKVNLGGTKGADALQKSPYLVAILASSIFWVGYDWLSIIVGRECGIRARCLCAVTLTRFIDTASQKPRSSPIRISSSPPAAC